MYGGSDTYRIIIAKTFNQFRQCVPLHPGILIQQEDVVGSVVECLAHADVVGFGEAEVLFGFDQVHLGEMLLDIGHAVIGGGIVNDNCIHGYFRLP